MDNTPNPGSTAAVEQGCRCPVIDNAHGAGYRGQYGIFIMTADCPLHGIDDVYNKNKEFT